MRGASARARLSIVAFALLTLALVAALAQAQESPPFPGGKVPSTLSLSLSEPSGFRRVGANRNGNVYVTTLRAEVTTTDVPTRLSIAEGETDRLLQSWPRPVTRARAKIRVRRTAPNARVLRRGQKLLLVTLTAGGP